MEAANFALALINQAGAIKIAAGELEDAAGIYAYFAEMQKRVAQVEAPGTSKRGSSSGADKYAKFMQSALDKIQELNLKILKTQTEITGASQATLKVKETEIQRQKELDELRRRAAEAGALNSKELAEAERLTNELYDMILAVDKYNEAWDPAIRKMQQAIDLSSALGAASGEATLRLREQQRAMVADNPFLATDEKMRQLQLLDAEIARLLWDTRFTIQTVDEIFNQYGETVDGLMQRLEQVAAGEEYLRDLYNDTSGALNVLIGQIEALNLAYQNGSISEQLYTLRMNELLIKYAEVAQVMGDATFVDGVNLALNSVVENFEGVANGLTETWGNFFTSFTQGFSNSIGQALIQSESLRESLGNIARQALAELISGMIQLGIQWAIQAALGQSLAAASTAAGVAQAATLTAAYTPAATMASVASFGSAPAIGVAALQAVISMIPSLLSGFASGGYTGNFATNQISGVVHGQEYVMNASTVRSLGIATLDSIQRQANSGSHASYSGPGTVYSGSGSSTVQLGGIVIENHIEGASFDTRVDEENRIRIIARREAEAIVRKNTPTIMAQEMSNPQSQFSRTLGDNTNVTRRR